MIADIHFQPKYVFAAIDAGCAAVRVNPGNIRQFDDKVGEIARAAMAAGVPIRIGVNAGSLDKRLLEKYGKATPEALVESALWECSLFEEHGFRDIKISVKHNDPVVMIQAYRQLAEQCDYPLHLGVTEAGPTFQGTIKSSVAFGALLAEGIGDTIRVSLSAPPVEEIKVGNAILESLGLRERGLEIVSCPSCGRAQVDVYTLAEQVTAGARRLPGAAAGRRHGLRRQRSGRGPRGRPRCRVRQRQGSDLRQGRGHQDRARVADRRDPGRGGAAAGREMGVELPEELRGLTGPIVTVSCTTKSIVPMRDCLGATARTIGTKRPTNWSGASSCECVTRCRPGWRRACASSR